MLVRIEQWGLGSDEDDVYRAPETRRHCLRGVIYGHHRKPDGSSVQTSPVVSVNGREVTTKSGTIYLLGEPHPDYVEYLRGIGRSIDPEQPIKVVRS